MATEKTRLLKKPFEFLKTASLAVDLKSDECIVVVPANYKNDHHIEQCLGLTLDELMFYTYDPFWRLLRRAIFISFWILLLAIFASACIISIAEYKQQCITTIKSTFPINYLANVDVFSRANFSQSANAMASIPTFDTFVLGAASVQ